MLKMERNFIIVLVLNLFGLSIFFLINSKENSC